MITFNFSENKGKRVSLILHNDTVKTGILTGLMPDDVVLLDMEPSSGYINFTGVDQSKISEIIVLDN